MRKRPTARVLLLDPDDRLLLQCIVTDTIHEPGKPPIPELWCGIGGGVNDGESYEEAAHREAKEETGIKDLELGPWVWTRDLVMEWKGELVFFTERYFMARTATTEIIVDGMEEEERQSTKEYRWWEPNALLAAEKDTIFKPDVIPSGLSALLKCGPPSEPIQVT